MQAGRIPRLSVAEVERNASSYVDPNGYVFSHEGTIYRAIKRSVAPFYSRLFQDGIIQALTETRHLVASEMTELEIDDPDVAFIVRHETIEPAFYCVEWPPEMLRIAGLITIDLLSDLLERNGTLQDAYPWNVLFRGTEPVFLDLTSIVEIDTPYLWPAYDQFQAFFLRPLTLSRQGRGALARALMLNNIAGVTRRDFYRHTGFVYKAMHPLAGLGFLADEYIQARPGLKRRLRRAAQRQGAGVDKQIRARFYKRLRRKLEALSFDRSADVWSGYYQEIGPGVDKEAKIRIVGDLLERLQPKTVLDVGCNTGAFSVMAAERGARVISVDMSESCINLLYNRASADRLLITPLISDILCPTPAFGFMGVQYPSLIERARSETALCLALMHHLHISGRQSFDRIAKLMDALADQHLIFEFVAMDDENNDLLGAGREIDYDLESVTVELRRYFPAIETFDSDRPTRKILLCSKR